MAKPRRVLRLQKLILQVAAQALHREVRDPRIGLVTLTQIKLSPDLTTAVLYWSQLGSESERRTTERGLKDALPMIQRRIAGSMTTRVTPRLSLRFDETMERAQELEVIFQQLRTERNGGALEPEDEALPEGQSEADAPDLEADQDAGSDAEALPPSEDDVPPSSADSGSST